MQNSKTLLYFLLLITVMIGCTEIIHAQKKFNTFRELAPDDFHFQLFSQDDRVVLDVRTSGEFRKSHLPGAINAMNQQILKEIADTLDSEQSIFVYCESGDRSLTAAIILSDKGFVNVYNLSGGIDAWIKQGYSLESGKKHKIFKP